MISAAMEACVVENSIVKQEALIPQLVNGVQDPGFTPHEEFMLRSAPTVAPSVPCVHQVPDISRKTFSALKDQIRINRGLLESSGCRLLRRRRIQKGANKKNGDCPFRLMSWTKIGQTVWPGILFK